MKQTNNITRTITTKIRTAISWLVCIAFVFVAATQVSAQPVCTNVANNNGNGKVTFNFRNNNAYAVIITDISSVCSNTLLTATEAWYRTTPLAFGSAAAFPALTSGNWIQFGSSTISGVASGTTTTGQSFFNGGLNLLVPAGATYGIAINAASASAQTTGNLRYSTLTAGITYTTSSGGCDIINGGLSTAGASAAGAPRLSSTAFSFYPRGFIGCVTFIPAIPCSGQPNAGTITAPASICPSTNFTVSATGLTAGTGVTYTWQSATSCNGPWTNIAGATSASLTANITAATSFRVITSCSNSGLSNTSNCVSVAVNPFLGCYCASNATSNADEDITNVTLGTLNNSSSCGVVAPGPGSVASQYSNFTTSVSAPVLAQGSTVSASVTMTSCGGSYGNKSRMWIDFDQNGSYDAAELVLDGTFTTGNHTATASVLIPPSALPGITGMRVVNVESTVVNACGTYSWGETEDYYVNIIAGNACSGIPNPGNTVASLSSICTGSSVSLSIQNVPTTTGNSYQWQSGPSSSGPWTNFGPNQPNTTASPTTNTWYQCIVTCSNSSGTSNPVQVGINSFLSCYCASNATSNADEDITNVTLGTLNNSSSCFVVAPGPGSVASQYSNFTTSVTAPTLLQGASYPASVTMTTCGGNYGNKSRMWIDFNQSGTYDASELVLDGALTTGNHTATSTVNVPLNAILGTTGMRVVNVESSTVNACGTYTWGETEDYRVNIAPSNNCNGTPTPGNTLSSLSAVCNNSAQAFTLSLSNTPSTLGNTFKWQSAPTANGPWTNLGAGGSCNYIFRLTDTFGDGWNGAQMQVRQGTSVVATLGSTFTTGFSIDVPVSLSSSTSFNLFWSVQGSWPDEVGIQILNEAGTVIYTYTAQPTNWPSFLNTTLHSWTTNACGSAVQGPTYSVASQFVATWYRAEVTCTFSGLTATSAPIQVGSVLCYCASAATSTADDEIFNVTIGTLNNSSTCASVAPGPGSLQNRYSNYAGFATVPNLGQGTSVPFSVTVGQCGGFAYSGYVRIFIDGNQDGDFDDAGELGYTSPLTTFQVGGTVLSGNIIIPNCATLGNTRMRVVAIESSLPAVNGCGTYTWGETEDYTVNIVFTAPVPAVASNINGPTNASCNTTLAYSVGPGYSGSIQWQFSTDQVNYTNISNATNVNQSLVANGPATFYLRVRFIGTGCTPDAFSNVITTVIAPPPIAFATSSPSTDICRGTSVTITANSVVPGPYAWNTAATSQSITVSPLVTTSYSVSVGSGLCIANSSITLNVIGGPVATSALTPTGTSCPGTEVTLTSQLIPGAPGGTYTGASIPHAPITIAGTAGPTGDDVLGGPYSIPFNFTFYGNSYNNIYISTNGFVSFDATAGSGCCSGQLIPFSGAPNNVIALAWDDLNNTTNGISYATVGSAPNRVFVIRFNNVPHFGGGGSPVSGQIHLYESTNVIEIHTTQMTNDGSNHTQGIENATGSLANAVPGRNASLWNGALDAYRFTPDPGITFTYAGPVTYSWSGTNGFSASTQNATDNPQVTTTYTLTVADNLCSSSTTLTKNIFNPPSVFGFNGGPYCEGQNALFFGFGTPGTSGSTTCNYIFRLTDSFGDGWNGATMQVRQGATVVTTLGPTFTNGSTIDIPVTLAGNTPYTLFYVNGGTYPSEVGLQIINQSNTTLYTLAAGAGTVGSTLYSWTTAACSGSAGSVTYAWSGPNNFSSTDQNPLVSGLTASNAGQYTVTVTDQNSCTAQGFDFLTVNDNPDVDYTTFSNETCPGYSNGLMEIGISGGDGSYSISDGGLYSTFGSPAQFTGVAPGTYFFSISDGNLCGTTTSITVGIEPNIPPVLV
ncbi:MAG: GEVED domain-containing protein, partial [Bacteroidota bacterium]